MFHLSRGKLRIHKIKNELSEVVADRNEIAAVIEGFHQKLYDQASRRNQEKASRM